MVFIFLAYFTLYNGLQFQYSTLSMFILYLICDSDWIRGWATSYCGMLICSDAYHWNKLSKCKSTTFKLLPLRGN